MLSTAAALSAVMIDTKTDLTESGGETEEITTESWTQRPPPKPRNSPCWRAYSVFLIVDITVNNWSVVHRSLGIRAFTPSIC